MAAILSDEDVFGPVATPSTPVAQKRPIAALSDSAVFGDDLLARVKAESTPWELFKRGAVDTVVRVGKGTAAAADMLLGIPGQALGVGADIGARAAAFGSGESRTIQGQAGEAAKKEIPAAVERFLRMSPGGLTAPLQTIIKGLGGGEEYDQSSVTNAIEHVAEGVDKKTRGYIKAADVKSYLDAFMLSAGARGTDLGVEAAAKPKQKLGVESRTSYVEQPAAEIPSSAETPKGELEVISSPKQVKQIFTDAKKAGYSSAGITVSENELAAMFQRAKENAPADSPPATPLATGIEKIATKLKYDLDPAEIAAVKAVVKGETPVGGWSFWEPYKPVDRLFKERSNLGKRNQAGFTDPEFIVLSGLFGGPLVVAAKMMWDEYKRDEKFREWLNDPLHKVPEPEPNDPEGKTYYAEKIGVGAGIAAAAMGHIKPAGGNWHPEAAAKLADSMKRQLVPRLYALEDAKARRAVTDEAPAHPDVVAAAEKERPIAARVDKMIKGYLEKHAGTATDPLTGIVPVEQLDLEARTLKGQIAQHEKRAIPTMKDIPVGAGTDVIRKQEFKIRNHVEREELAKGRRERLIEVEEAIKSAKDGLAYDKAADIEVPFGEGTKKWGELMEAAIVSQKAKVYQEGPFRTNAARAERDAFAKAHPEEDIYELSFLATPKGEEAAPYQGRPGLGVGRALTAITNQISHIGDYLRQNVDPAELGQYDFVRAFQETAKNDARVAKEMEKSASASTAQLPVYKDYGDGMKWVELKLPEKLTEEQAKGVHKVTIEELRKQISKEDWEAGLEHFKNEGIKPTVEDFQDFHADSDYGRPKPYVAVDKEGKPIQNSYTQEPAQGNTPEEAWLAGRLVEEGNSLGHCVGGYCDTVASGELKIYSLRGKDGKSHVTIEVSPENKINSSRLAPPDEFEGSLQDWMDQTGKATQADIVQIKGKQNRAPIAAYLPYVQDFVRSGKWGEVWDLANAGLRERAGLDIKTIESSAFSKFMHERFGEDRFVKNEDHDAAIAEYDSKFNALGKLRREAGSIDPKLLLRLAAVSAGAAIGGGLADDKLLGAIVGGIGAGAVTKLSPARAAQAVRNAFKADDRIRINKFADEHDAGIARAARAIWQQQQDVVKSAPETADRNAITNAIQQNTVGNLSPTNQVAARQAESFFAAAGQQGQSAGVLNGLIDNYVTNLWDLNGKNKGVWEQILQKAGGPSMSPTTRFALKRSIQDIETGKQMGLTPLTEDVAEIMGIYGNALYRAIENKKMLTALKAEVDPASGTKLILPSTKAPHLYVVIDHPQMNGLRVHPDIAPSMKFIFDNSDPGVVMAGLAGVNTALKRSAVSFSLFHAKALVDAEIGAHGVLKGIPMAARDLAQAAAPQLFGQNKFLKQLREGGVGDIVDQAQAAGLKFSFEKGKLADEDVGGSFYTALTLAQKGLDSIVPGAGLPIKGIAAINHAVDTFMWERLHAGMKLGTFASKLEVLRNNDAAQAARQGRAPRTEEQLAEQAASFTNDIYGGLNWRKIAEEAHTKWGRDIALAAYSPKGRQVAQLLVFAPDWTLSTTRAATRAAGEILGYEKGSGWRSFTEPQNATDLHRQYIARSAFYYALIGDGINYALSGHHLWDNKDWTMIDMGDGRTMQWSKHSMEPIHWMTKPGQQALNKLAFFPKEAANQMLGTEYLSARGTSPRMNTSLVGRGEHALKSMTPIAVQQSIGDKASQGGGMAGFLGVPIYGKTFEERREMKEQRKRDAIKKRIEKREREAR